jgi:hypothetical protein
MSNQENYASVINGVIDNVIMVNPERLPKPRDGETLIPMSQLPAGAWTGWRLVEGVWVSPPQPPSFDVQAVEDAFNAWSETVFDEEAQRISLIPLSSRTTKERDTAEAREAALEKAISEKKALLDSLEKGIAPESLPDWFNR